MLSNLYKQKWNLGLKMDDKECHSKKNEEALQTLSKLAENY
jgi:hypothetical protein